MQDFSGPVTVCWCVLSGVSQRPSLTNIQFYNQLDSLQKSWQLVDRAKMWEIWVLSLSHNPNILTFFHFLRLEQWGFARFAHKQLKEIQFIQQISHILYLFTCVFCYSCIWTVLESFSQTATLFIQSDSSVLWLHTLNQQNLTSRL